jgi:hypothetical protein
MMLPRARRRPLRPGQEVWVWFGWAVIAGTFRGRVPFPVRRYWVVLCADGSTHYFRHRRHLFLSEADAKNAAPL